jgi:hypothetical protein
MKKLFLAALFSLTLSTTNAEAQCLRLIRPGLLSINHRVGILYGGNFTARVACSRFAPAIVRWNGGLLCAGGSFYGRTYYGMPWRCEIRSIGLR